MAAVTALNAHTRKTFVAPAVKETAVTSALLDDIMPYFPKACRCIAGYLDSSDQYWKVNYHWDLLVSKIDDLLAMDTVAEKYKNAARAIRNVLMTKPPDPERGYRNDKTVGATKDRSTPEVILARYTVLKQSKRDFETVIVKAKLVDPEAKKNPSPREKPWWLAVAPVAQPGLSNHGTGYALDIAGNNLETKRIAASLGASLVFNEASHVHCEWKTGAKIPR